MKIKRGQISELKAITRLYCKIWPKENQERVEYYFSGKIKNKEIFVAYEDKKPKPLHQFVHSTIYYQGKLRF